MLNDVEFSYEGMTSPLFSRLSLQFSPGWTGIVGENGVGKSTLLKVISGELAPQWGTVQRFGRAMYICQRTDEMPEFFEDFLWAPDSGALKSRLKIGEDWNERWNSLSHGERKRAQIAVALWMEPEILSLDEPGNHIDAEARELLLRSLRNFQGVGLLVSHDRELLDELCGHTLIMDSMGCVLRPGGISEALAQQKREEEALRREDNVLKKTASRLRTEAQRRKMVADQKAAAARGSRQKSLHDNDARERRNLARLTGKDAYAGKLAGQMKLRAAQVEAQRAGIKLKKYYETGIWVDEASFAPGDFLLRLPNGSIPLGKNQSLRYPDLEIYGTDRRAITGANGSGKSTLLRFILSEISLTDKLVYIPQEITAWESRSILDSVKRLSGKELGRVMTTISRLGSRPGRLLESVQPSPGEIRKLLLALGIVKGPHLIVMDEPTNHMDITGILCLEEALASCPCAMLLVSHDQHFLRKTTRKEWSLKKGAAASELKIMEEPAP